MNRISSNYEENVQWFNDVLGAGRSCDMVCRDLYVGGRRARFWVIDGFGGDAILERMGAFWLSLQPEAVQGLTEMQQFADRYVTFMEVNVSYDRDDIVTSVLMGKSLLVMEGLSGAALIDAKEYPSRSVGEPPDGKVLRGSHDGFIEAVVPNMAMLRRRIRDPHLTMEGLKVGQRTHSATSSRTSRPTPSPWRRRAWRRPSAPSSGTTPSQRCGTLSGRTPPPPASWRAASS